MRPNVVAVIGAGGMGLASARRLGAGRRILLADYSKTSLDEAAKALKNSGHEVDTHVVDVSKAESVSAFAKVAAAGPGNLDAAVHTAGLSPAMAPSRRLFEVDLLGTANVIDAFQDKMGPGSSVTCIASIARLMSGRVVSDELDQHLRTAPTAELLTHPEINLDDPNPGIVYGLSKYANVVRVQAAAARYADRGARINSISPGLIITGMIAQELEGGAASAIKDMISGNPMRRGGTAEEIANVVAFLSGPEASYINGTDIVVDGGQTAMGWKS